MLPLTVESFRAFVPNFVDTPDLVIQAEIDRAVIMTKGYEAMPTPALQELALIYHVCHYLTLSAAQQSGMGGGAVNCFTHKGMKLATEHYCSLRLGG